MAFIPDEAIDRLCELTKGARHLYVFLARCRNQKTGRCFPSLTTTQENLDINRSSVFALRQELIDKDWARFTGDEVIWLRGFNDDANMPSANTAAILYVLTDGAGHYKIGQTTNLEQRIRSLSTGMPMDLSVTFSYRTTHGRKEERRWHKEFSPKRLKGEWFALTEEDLNLIRRNADSPEIQTKSELDVAEKVSPENQTTDDESATLIPSPEIQTQNSQSEKSDSESKKSGLEVQKITSGSPEIQTAYKEEPAKEPAKITSKGGGAKRAPDPRINHAAIQTCRGITERYPPKAIWDKIISVLGDTPNAALLEECRSAWVERGFNANSWIWATEWYLTGVPQWRVSNGKHDTTKTSPTRTTEELGIRTPRQI